MSLPLWIVAGLCWATGLGVTLSASAQDWLVGNRAADVEVVASPFVRRGEAVRFGAPSEHAAGLVWQSDEVVPGQRYSLSFFYQNFRAENPAMRPRLDLHVYDGYTLVHRQILYRKNEAQFFAAEMVFSSNRATVRLDVPAGEEVVVGEFGKAVNVADLASEFVQPLNSTLWMSSMRLPDAYRGLRKFVAEVQLSNKRYSDNFGLEALEVTADMMVTSAKLPRILPGENQLNLVGGSGSEGGRVIVAATARPYHGEARVFIDYDEEVPADGVTFGRVFLNTADDSDSLVTGAFYRLVTPPEVDARPFGRAIADSQKLQVSREFHLTAILPGAYEIAVERWHGADWADTGERFSVEFQPVDQPAPAFQHSDYARRWFEPATIPPGGESPRELRIDLPPGDFRLEQAWPIESALAPELSWRVEGPVRNLGLHSDFQPDPRTLQTTAASLRKLVGRGAEDPELQYALGVEAYVALFMEGLLPEQFPALDYPSLGRIHREGRGWCMQYSSGVFALAVEGGLEARYRNLPRHVLNEVRGQELPITTLDAMVQVAVTTPEGERIGLDALADENSRVLGAGRDGQAARGSESDYYHGPIVEPQPWMKRDDSNPAYRNQFLDNEIVNINLKAGESLHWVSGSVEPAELDHARGVRSEHQNILTQRSRFTPQLMMEDPDVSRVALVPNEVGLLAPDEGYKVGTFRLPLEYPVEVSDLALELTGSIDPGGEVRLSFYPHLEPALVEGLDWCQPEN